MYSGFCYGHRRGGFAFQGTSPAWPYVGVGRGGLPRCGYYQGELFYRHRYPHHLYSPFVPFEITKEEEVNFLKQQAEYLKSSLNRVEARIHEFDAKS